MSKIYTRRGDTGETSLVGGSLVAKNSERVEAYGTIDEANSAIGLARAALQVAAADELELDMMLDFMQHRLFDCSSVLATPAAARPSTHTHPAIHGADIEKLEAWIDSLTAQIGEVSHFVLPGGCEEASRLHVARTVVRRAERCMIALQAAEPGEVDPNALAFINRLSDLLFTMARYTNRLHGSGDVLWDART